MPSPSTPDFGIGRLRDEGYDVAFEGGELVVLGLPFVDGDRNVTMGALAAPLNMSAGRVAAPSWHYCGFRGGVPCDASGRKLPFVNPMDLAELRARGWNAGLCLVPPGREFEDYHELVSAYVAAIVGQAQRIDPCATALGPGHVVEAGRQGPFAYADLASVRAGTTALTARLASAGPVGIVGLGGTGSYVLDLVAKTPVPAIHLFDDDEFLQHNAFRAPGAATAEDLGACRSKVDHFAAVYSAMHQGIVPHRVQVCRRTAGLLAECVFVFVCVDDGGSRRSILTMLAALGVASVDVGMGLRVEDDGIAGIVRVGGGSERQAADGQVEPEDVAGADPYRANIQIAELNALNAALAVIAWKKAVGFYSGEASPMVFVLEAGAIVQSRSGEGGDPAQS